MDQILLVDLSHNSDTNMVVCVSLVYQAQWCFWGLSSVSLLGGKKSINRLSNRHLPLINTWKTSVKNWSWTKRSYSCSNTKCTNKVGVINKVPYKCTERYKHSNTAVPAITLAPHTSILVPYWFCSGGPCNYIADTFLIKNVDTLTQN